MSAVQRFVSLLRMGGCLVLSAAFPAAGAVDSGVELVALDPARLENFVDGLMTAHLGDHRVAGAVIVVVQEGEVLLAKGYGWADVAARRPVDATSTLFRIGSVSKLFTWTAVMQLVEAEELDLDVDVNEYLDFPLPATFPQPITLRHLMTHTPGFEERTFGLFASRAVDLEPTGEWLAANLPARVRPPGTFSAYSNYGVALAGYLVKRVSGLEWEDYVEQRILQPLEMRLTTPRQPPPAPLEDLLSRGYTFEDGRFVAQGFELIRGAAAAGSVSATALDMARFMITHLEEGELEGHRILEEETVRSMRRRLFGHDPRLNGFAHGFYEMSSHGQRIVGHGGDTGWFHTLLALLPEHELGLFVSYNSAGGGEITSGPFLEAILDQFFPTPEAKELRAAPASLERGRRVAGAYRSNRSSYTTFEKALGLVMPVEVLAQPDGALVLRSPSATRRFIETEPYLFSEVEGRDRLLFRQDENGETRWAFVDSLPMLAFEKLRWFESPRLHRNLLTACSLVFLALLGGATLRGAQRLCSRERGRDGAGGLEVGAAVVALAFPLLLLLTVRGQQSFMYGEGLQALRVVLALPILCAALALASAVRLVVFWRQWGMRRRAVTVVVVATAAIYVSSLAWWNLLPWRLG